MEEIRKANRGCSAENLVVYFSENFPQNFTHGALLITECLADYCCAGELTVTEYVGKNYDPVDHHKRIVKRLRRDLLSIFSLLI